jgi:hypothetical protein
MEGSDVNAIKRILTPAVRRYLYGVAIASVPLAVALEWMKPEYAPIVVPLIVAVFNVEDDPKEPVG